MKIFGNGRYSIFKDDFEFRIRDFSSSQGYLGVPVLYEAATFGDIFNKIITYDDISFEDILKLTKLKSEIPE